MIQGENNYLNNLSANITKKAMENNIYMRPLGNTVYIMPPYCTTEIELKKVYQFIEQIIEH